MKINPSHIAKAMEVYRAQKPSAPSSKRKEEHKKDELILSEDAKVFQQTLKAINDNEAVDWAKVERIREQIEKGQYKVSPRQIAEKMVDDLFNRKRI